MSGEESHLPLNRAFVVQFGTKLNSQIDKFQGRAEHIASGKVIHFSSQMELLDFMITLLGEAALSSNEPDGP